MNEETKLSVLDWLDDVLKEYVEFEELAAAQDPEFEKLYSLIEKWNNNLFPKKADKDGIALFEQLLNITPLPNEDLEDRRYRVIAKLNAKLPYTEVQLRRILGGILGYDGFKLTVKDLILTVSLAENNNNKLDIIHELLKEIVPLNVLIVIHQLVSRRGKTYAGCYLKVANTVRINPMTVDNVEVEGKFHSGIFLKIGNVVKVNPKGDQ